MSKDFVSLEVYDQIKNLKNQIEHERRYSKALEARIADLESVQEARAQGVEAEGRVAIPRDVAEAKGMYLVGYSWLKHNAPDELTNVNKGKAKS